MAVPRSIRHVRWLRFARRCHCRCCSICGFTNTQTRATVAGTAVTRLLPSLLLLQAVLAFQGAAHAGQLILNPGFETQPFPSSWTAANGAVAVAGLNGSATAARLPYNTNASLTQNLASTTAEFTADISFQIAGSNEDQALRWTLLAGGATAVELRTATGGMLQVKDAGAWKSLLRLSEAQTSRSPRTRPRGFGSSAGISARQMPATIWSGRSPARPPCPCRHQSHSLRHHRCHQCRARRPAFPPRRDCREFLPCR